MKTSPALLATFLIMTVFFSCSKKDQVETAVIEEITGEIFVVKNGVKQKAVKGMKLYQGDILITGGKSSAEISYNKNKIKIYEKSELSIKKLKSDPKTDEKNSEFFLSEGRVYIDSSGSSKQKNKLTIISPDSSASSADSKYFINTIKGETRIESKDGNIETINTATGKKINVLSGQKISVSKKTILNKPVKKVVPSEFSAVKPGVEVPRVK